MTDDEVNLYREKKKSVRSVFDKKLQTDRGKKCLREYERDYDAQSVNKKLNSFCTESTNSRVSVSTTLSYITSAKIESWKGTSEAFMLHWQDQIRVCETLMPTDSDFFEHQKRIMLENAVASAGSLRAIKDQSDQYFTKWEIIKV